MRVASLLTALFVTATAVCWAQDPLPPEWRKARDAQDRATLERIASDAQSAAQRNAKDAKALYLAALADGLRAEVLMELHDKKASSAAAESGIDSIKKAIALRSDVGEYHRLYGTLCAQTIPASAVLNGLRYGHCAQDEVNTATKLDPGSSMAWLSRGVGYNYLPASFGGGPELALKDIEHAIKLDPKNSEAWLWQGIVLHKLNRDAEARKSLEKALALNPARLWSKQQMDKLPDK